MQLILVSSDYVAVASYTDAHVPYLLSKRSSPHQLRAPPRSPSPKRKKTATNKDPLQRYRKEEPARHVHRLSKTGDKILIKWSSRDEIHVDRLENSEGVTILYSRDYLVIPTYSP